MKIIVIEGIDGSGKNTQGLAIRNFLHKQNIKVRYESFPQYNTSTGKIVAGPYLGKSEYGNCVFDEGAAKVGWKVASLYFVADRIYNMPRILKECETDSIDVCIFDRYSLSNMAHQGGKILREARDKGKSDYEAERDFEECMNDLDWLEFNYGKLPHPTHTIFLYQPWQAAQRAANKRGEMDGHESDADHLRDSEFIYLKLCEKYGWDKIEVLDDGGSMKSREEVFLRVAQSVCNHLEIPFNKTTALDFAVMHFKQEQT